MTAWSPGARGTRMMCRANAFFQPARYGLSKNLSAVQRRNVRTSPAAAPPCHCIPIPTGSCHPQDTVPTPVKPPEQPRQAAGSTQLRPPPVPHTGSTSTIRALPLLSAPLFQFGSEENAVIKLQILFFIISINYSFRSFILRRPRECQP